MSASLTTANSIAEILEIGFEEVSRKQGSERFETLAAQAEFLDISPGYLSKLRHGRVPIGDELAAKLARRFASDDLKLREEFEQAIRDRRENPMSVKSQALDEIDISPNAILEFFKRIGTENSLLCVEYRDYPQALKNAAFPHAASAAAEAIFNGLSFAMFQPFGTVENLKASLTSTINAVEHPHGTTGLRLHYYLLDLALRIREVNREISEEVGLLERTRNSKARGRIVLFEPAKDDIRIFGCGIQSRLFYASYFVGKRHFSEVYDWVAGVNDHYFIQRGNDSVSIDAVREQFHPITTEWALCQSRPNTKFCLPHTKQELQRIWNSISGKNKSSEINHWCVWEPKA